MSKNAAYRYAFCFFSTGVHGGDECFESNGYRNLKKKHRNEWSIEKAYNIRYHIDILMQ